MLLKSSEHKRLDDVDQNSVKRIECGDISSAVTDTEGEGHVTMFVVFVFRYYSVPVESCLTLYVVSTPNNALCRRDK
jgi:hypothetical protein